jgi:hypothetical protein
MNLIAPQKRLNLDIHAFNVVTCHNQPADVRAFFIPSSA